MTHTQNPDTTLSVSMGEKILNVQGVAFIFWAILLINSNIINKVINISIIILLVFIIIEFGPPMSLF